MTDLSTKIEKLKKTREAQPPKVAERLLALPTDEC